MTTGKMIPSWTNSPPVEVSPSDKNVNINFTLDLFDNPEYKKKMIKLKKK